MKKIILTIFLLLSSMPVLAGTERLVTNESDKTEEGTLRVVLQDACDTAGDDDIRFADTRLARIRIDLKSPLVIPEDCRGSVTLEGSDEVDTLLDGSKFSGGGGEAGDSCILNVYSDNHTVRNFSFVNNEKGAGVCLFGRDNVVEESRFGAGKGGAEEPNRYGIVVSDVFSEDYPEMDGNGNDIRANVIGPNDRRGVWVEASDVTIGGDSFDDDRNIIEGNGEGGIFVVGKDVRSVHVTHNTISANGDGGLGIDLNDDGVSLNDLTDADTGPNTLLNFLDHLQVFPLVPDTDGVERYWGWGVGLHGARLEVYTVGDEDSENDIGYGGGESFLADGTLEDFTFEIHPDISVLETGDVVTALVFDDEDNTSEFSMNINVGHDADLDGIADDFETGGAAGSSADDADSDGDGLPDPAEDKNRNGVWDEDLGETSAYLADSDEDGITDWFEVRGDGVFDEGVDSNPLSDDSDEDGLADGEEDQNGNGVWESYLGETSPLLEDSDGDGVDDPSDDCPAVYNPYQEEWYCRL